MTIQCVTLLTDCICRMHGFLSEILFWFLNSELRFGQTVWIAGPTTSNDFSNFSFVVSGPASHAVTMDSYGPLIKNSTENPNFKLKSIS